MKRTMYLVIGLVLAGGGVAFWQQRGTETPEAADALPAVEAETQVLGVEKFMREVDRYPGTVRVEGVVSAVAADEHALTLIDRAELERCEVVTCAPLSLPVRWNGPMPSMRDVVRIAGQVQDEKGKLFLLAGTVEKVDPGRETKPTP